MSDPLYEFIDASVSYDIQDHKVTAVENIHLAGYAHETLGIVGESGCGKSTLAKALLQLQPLSKGKILFEKKDLSLLSSKQLRRERRGFQSIFQDPDSSLNPRMTIYAHLREALSVHNPSKKEFQTDIEELLAKVILPAEHMYRYPHELSGGQKQRASIARALAVKPKLLVLDEPLSSLDVSIRVQIIQLLLKLQREENLSYFFITHDLATLRYLAHRIAVLYLGQIMELATKHTLYTSALHPYTHALLSAVPLPDPVKARNRSRIALTGDIPSLFNPPKGCPFHTRCPFATDLCKKVKPLLEEKSEGHFVACHFPQILSHNSR